MSPLDEYRQSNPEPLPEIRDKNGNSLLYFAWKQLRDREIELDLAAGRRHIEALKSAKPVAAPHVEAQMEAVPEPAPEPAQLVDDILLVNSSTGAVRWVVKHKMNGKPWPTASIIKEAKLVYPKGHTAAFKVGVSSCKAEKLLIRLNNKSGGQYALWLRNPAAFAQAAQPTPPQSAVSVSSPALSPALPHSYPAQPRGVQPAPPHAAASAGRV